MLTPTLRFKAQMFPKMGLLPLRTSEFPRRGGFQLSLSRVIVGLFMASGNAGNYFFARYYVDDGILVELQWWPDGRRCLRAVQSLAPDHFRLLVEGGVSDPPLLSARKITDWDTQLEVLRWIIDTEALTVTCRPISASSCKISLRSGPRLVQLLQRGRCRSSLASLYMSPLLCVRGGFS